MFFFSSILSTAHSASPIQFNKYEQTTRCTLSPAVDQIKGSSMHPLEGSCLGYCVIPYFRGFDMRCWGNIDPAAKKSSIFTITPSTHTSAALPLFFNFFHMPQRPAKSKQELSLDHLQRPIPHCGLIQGEINIP